ncbi:hypothetical protein FOA52_003957 [Chlamydomonas sp. UWO 241]|nr:hypothetical protein FOA52_003957 [Chlamydomonas sp. UWO 241]
MQQFTRERAGNTVFERLLEYIQYKVDFVNAPEGPLKDPYGPAFRTVMVDSDEGDWAADLIKTLGLTDEHLFE